MSTTNASAVLYDVWLLIPGQGADIFEEVGTPSWQEGERIAQSYRQTARCTGYAHFQYIVHQRGSPPPASQSVLDDLPFGDPRLGENGLTYTEQEVLGAGREEGAWANEQQEGMWEEQEEEGLLTAFLRGKILHETRAEEEEEEVEPDERYRQTWPYRHSWVPPLSAEQEQQDAGGEENDDSLFFF